MILDVVCVDKTHRIFSGKGTHCETVDFSDWRKCHSAPVASRFAASASKVTCMPAAWSCSHYRRKLPCTVADHACERHHPGGAIRRETPSGAWPTHKGGAIFALGSGPPPPSARGVHAPPMGFLGGCCRRSGPEKTPRPRLDAWKNEADTRRGVLSQLPGALDAFVCVHACSHLCDYMHWCASCRKLVSEHATLVLVVETCNVDTSMRMCDKVLASHNVTLYECCNCAYTMLPDHAMYSTSTCRCAGIIIHSCNMHVSSMMYTCICVCICNCIYMSTCLHVCLRLHLHLRITGTAEFNCEDNANL